MHTNRYLILILVVILMLTAVQCSPAPTSAPSAPVEEAAAPAEDAAAPAEEAVAPVEEAAAPAEEAAPPAEEAASAPPAGGTALDGKALFEGRCASCHGLDRTTSKKKSADAWKSTVERMVAKGAELTPEEQAAVIDYLAATYPE